MQWIELKTLNQLEELMKESKKKTALIFKHSTQCSVSKTALNRLERSWADNDNLLVTPYYLDLISYRTISNSIATTFDIEHQSPQILIIQNGQSMYNSSHLDIDYRSIKAILEKLKILSIKN